ncbi:MAG TPA: aconitate hydratase AcnA [Candidatus Dormibacteraeota bacterium]|nr:aconitate hydratase AcnA [Candidatus Dormibacteraeota bacterium]
MKGNFDFAKGLLDTYRGKARYYSLRRMKEIGCDLEQLPYSVRVLLENMVRAANKIPGASDAAYKLSQWPKTVGEDMPFMPYRVLLQDYTGVPLIVDLAAMRSAFARRKLDPKTVNSKVPVDLIIDHSVQVDSWNIPNALFVNLEKEYERNSERYALLKWAHESFSSIRVFPPGKGICHQVNLEYLAKVVELEERADGLTALPDTLVGTDSHTTMVNGIGVVGWGVGGIEAEAVMLGEPYYMPIPRVLGVKLTGQLKEGATPTDLVLTVTEALRKENLVGAFVEYFGEAYAELSVPDRATLGNMSPEYGATMGFSPVDEQTITYLNRTGRENAHARLVREYCELQGLFIGEYSPEPKYSKIITIDLGKIEPSIAGPRNPDERVPLKSASSLIGNMIQQYEKKMVPAATTRTGSIADDGYQLNTIQTAPRGNGTPSNYGELRDGSIVIAAITSCTNTSNPTVMVGAGLLARNALALGLNPVAYVKRSLAPGSKVVKDYLEKAGLLRDLESLGFNIVGYGCTTCIGNSGPLSPEIEKQIRDQDLYAVAVLSGNRNFDGRIHPLAKASFLMSPMLVVAYALVGRIDFDFYKEPLGTSKDGRKVFLKEIWPSISEIRETISRSLSPEFYRETYSSALKGDEKWNALKSSGDNAFSWDEKSTYIREPPWFMNGSESQGTGDILDARVLATFEDKITTDHISPAGVILPDSPAGLYLQSHGVPLALYSTYGSRRGNHEVMVRGGFANIRLKNTLSKGKEGGWTVHQPSGELMTIYDASTRYASENTSLLILAGKQYGAGSSRDWAAKAVKLLGVRAVIAESFERIHRSNLVAMGVLPLEFERDENWKTLGLQGDERFDIKGIGEIEPKAKLTVNARSKTTQKTFKATARLDNEVELEHYRDGGVLQYVYRKMTTP